MCVSMFKKERDIGFQEKRKHLRNSSAFFFAFIYFTIIFCSLSKFSATMGTNAFVWLTSMVSTQKMATKNESTFDEWWEKTWFTSVSSLTAFCDLHSNIAVQLKTHIAPTIARCEASFWKNTANDVANRKRSETNKSSSECGNEKIQKVPILRGWMRCLAKQNNKIAFHFYTRVFFNYCNINSIFATNRFTWP